MDLLDGKPNMSQSLAWYGPIPSAPIGFSLLPPDPMLRRAAGWMPRIVAHMVKGYRSVAGVVAKKDQADCGIEAGQAKARGYNPTGPTPPAGRSLGEKLERTKSPVKTVFTDYVRSLHPCGKPPDPKSFDRAWRALDQALRIGIRKRGLWECSPSYLGVYGLESWNQAGPRTRPGDAMEELLGGCYTYIFVRRLRSLKAQLKCKSNIEGMIALNIEHFLHDIQKSHDRFGYRVFEILRSAIREALKANELHVLAGDRRIRNDTILSFTPESDPANFWRQNLTDIARSWNDSLLPELITANASARRRVIADLRRLLMSLPAHGIDGFIFNQLIEPLKNDARLRWGALFEIEGGETATESVDDELISIVKMVYPDDSVEKRDCFQKLSSCMDTSLDLLPASDPTRDDLMLLWDYLRTYQDPSPKQPGKVPVATPPLSNARFPSTRKLSRYLGISRDRLPKLFQHMTGLVLACMATWAEATQTDPGAGWVDEPTRVTGRKTGG